MIINGSHVEETHGFKTIEACRAFCRVHTNFTPATAGNAGHIAIHKHGLFASPSNVEYVISGSNVQISMHDQLKETIQECKLSYKNIIIAGLLGSLTGTKYKMGTECISHPIIFSYGIAIAAPELTLVGLIACMAVLVSGALPWLNLMLLAFIVFTVEVIVPWINTFSVDPIEEPWLVPKWLDENGIER